TTYSFGLEDDIRITDYLNLVLGLSYDIQDPEYANGGKVRSSDDSLNPQVGLRWVLNDYTIAHASVGRKSRFPTLNDLYSSYLGSSIPNPGLEKETSINYEVGVEHDFADHTRFSLALFYSDVEDLIVRRKLPAGDMYNNAGKARFQGFEAGITTNFLPRQEITAHYTYLDAENRSAGRDNDHLEEVAKHKFFFSDQIKITDMIHLFAKFEWYDKRWEENVKGKWQEIDGFALLDAKIMVKLPRQIDIEAGFRNLFDKEYELSTGFPRPGRTAFAQVRYSF
ncbi:MAG: TonB-dependent receptor, partial [Deltaproteobacteria bacterium]|nr:TonB-dependent receptor [Candidatus Tharpella aukensis]